jgi:hypothetical protein
METISHTAVAMDRKHTTDKHKTTKHKTTDTRRRPWPDEARSFARAHARGFDAGNCRASIAQRRLQSRTISGENTAVRDNTITELSLTPAKTHSRCVARLPAAWPNSQSGRTIACAAPEAD